MSGEPKRFTYDDFLDELMRVAEDAQNCTCRLGSDRIRRVQTIDRLLILMSVGKDRIVPALRDAAQKLDGGRR